MRVAEDKEIDTDGDAQVSLRHLIDRVVNNVRMWRNREGDHINLVSMLRMYQPEWLPVVIILRVPEEHLYWAGGT